MIILKKFFAILISLVVFAGVFACPVYAKDSQAAATAPKADVSQSVEYFEDGSYMVTTIIQSEISLLAANSKTSTKSVDFFASNNEKKWTASLHATFTYTGSSCTANSSYTTYKIYDDAWKLKSSDCSVSGNKATGNFTFRHSFLGIPMTTKSTTITISCSATGVVS